MKGKLDTTVLIDDMFAEVIGEIEQSNFSNTWPILRELFEGVQQGHRQVQSLMVFVVDCIQEEPRELHNIHLDVGVPEYLLEAFQLAPIEVFQHKARGVFVHQPYTPFCELHDFSERSGF